jgi:hypothetical protein
MPTHPLAEVWGYATDNFTPEAQRHREKRLCPFNNKVPNCTKDKARDPLGVCSIYEGVNVAVTCPIRFREDWIIADDAAGFFFPENTRWTSLTEVRLKDKNGLSAGNIDIVLVAYDMRGRILDFGALEIQAVYISGNIRLPFEAYLEDPEKRYNMDWRQHGLFPRPDYLSSSRKRLAPQLIYKGGIFSAWGKRLAVAVDRHFFATLPSLPQTTSEQAGIAWLVYDLRLLQAQKRFKLVRHQQIYTGLTPALEAITKTEPGPVEDFINYLQEKLDEKLEGGFPPDAPTLLDSFRSE